MTPPDAVGDAVFDLVQLHSKTLIELLPEGHERRGELQTEMVSVKLVRRYVAQLPPDKAKTDWVKLVGLFVPILTLLAIIVAELLGIDWKGVMP